MAILADSFLSIGTTQTLVSVALILAVARLTAVYFSTIRYPSNLPRVYEDEKATSFSWKTRLSYFIDAQAMFKEAFEKYSKHGKTVLIPGLGFRDEVIVPVSSLRWITSQPDSTIDVIGGFKEMDQVESSFPKEKYVTDPWHGILIKKDMNAVLETIVVGLNDELQYAFDSRFGKDTEEWKEIKVLDTMKLLVAQAASRFTVGLPLCRNEAYLTETYAYNDNFVMNAGLVGAFPLILRPLIRPLAFIPMRYRLWKIKNHFKSLYHERFALLSSPKSAKEPQDHLQLMLRYAQINRPEELNIDDMTCRLVVANLGSYHQTTMAVCNILFNLVGSDAEYNTISALRDEISPILSANGGKWTKAAISQMWKADSVCRETLRLQSFGGRSLIRKVATDDVVTEDGIKLPKGCMVSILSWAGQTDGDIFDKPYEFDPFRYSRSREQQARSEKETTTPPQTFVSTGPQFLPFGHGKHACPGRFLVDFELKMIIGYLVMNYDMCFPDEYEGKRPESKWLAEACFPPPGGRIKIRRRKEGL